MFSMDKLCINWHSMVGCPPWQSSQDERAEEEIAPMFILSILFVKASNFAFNIVNPCTSNAPPFLGVALSLDHKLYVFSISSKVFKASSGVYDIIVPPVAVSMLTITDGFTPL